MTKNRPDVTPHILPENLCDFVYCPFKLTDGVVYGVEGDMPTSDYQGISCTSKFFEEKTCCIEKWAIDNIHAI